MPVLESHRCEHCGEEFLARIAKRTQRFCSRLCMRPRVGSLAGYAQQPPKDATPAPCEQVFDVDKLTGRRKWFCKKYDTCLEYACVKRWKGFACGDCPAYDPMSRSEIISEAAMLLRAKSRWVL